jgi:hypothetical protein
MFFLVDPSARWRADLGGLSSKELFSRRRARSGADARASASRAPPPRRSRSVHDLRRVPAVWLRVGAGAL